MPDHGDDRGLPDRVPPGAPATRPGRVRRARLDGGPPAGPMARHRPDGGTHAAERRVEGVHRVEGLAGTPGRYAAIVAFLVSMASLPTLFAISAGSATLAEDDAGRTTPFIAQRAEVPVVIVPVFPAPVGPRPTRVPVADGLDRPAGRSIRREAPEPTPTRPHRNQPPAPPGAGWAPPVPPARPPAGRPAPARSEPRHTDGGRRRYR